MVAEEFQSRMELSELDWYRVFEVVEESGLAYHHHTNTSALEESLAVYWRTHRRAKLTLQGAKHEGYFLQ